MHRLRLCVGERHLRNATRPGSLFALDCCQDVHEVSETRKYMAHRKSKTWPVGLVWSNFGAAQGWLETRKRSRSNDCSPCSPTEGQVLERARPYATDDRALRICNPEPSKQRVASSSLAGRAIFPTKTQFSNDPSARRCSSFTL
jgi:hypothetical protein